MNARPNTTPTDAILTTDNVEIIAHAAYPHEDRLLWGCAACERPCDRKAQDGHPGGHACVGARCAATPLTTA